MLQLTFAETPAPIGLSSGLPELDRAIGGLKSGDLLVLGGRPNTGKTILATGLSAQLAVTHSRTVGIFSLSSPKDQWRHRTRMWARDAQERYEVEEALLSDPRILIDDTVALDVWQICARARRLKLSYGLRAIVVDYLQVLADPHTREPSAVQAASVLKALAVELEITVIALTTLQRSLEQREDRRPRPEDLPPPIAYEVLQTADALALCYRDELYTPTSAAAGLAEITVLQPKLGQTHHLRFELRGSRFVPLSG